MKFNELKNLTHAYYLIGTATLRSELINFLEKTHKIPSQANPDLFDRSYETFTIDDARELKSFHDTRPIGKSEKKVFVVFFNSITVEAQNALLKLLEEPSDYAHFFLIIPSAHLLLPTVKSRLQLMETEAIENEELVKEAEKFLKLSTPKRLEYIKDLLDEISDEKKSKQDGVEFVNALEKTIYEKRGVRDSIKALESIQLIKKYLNDRAPSMKMLLEFAALNLD